MGLTFDTPDGRLRRRAGLALRPRRAGRARLGRQADLSLPPAAGGALPRRLAPHGEGRRLLAQHPQGEGSPDLPRHPVGARSSPRPRATTWCGFSSRRNAAATCISSSPACRSSPKRIGAAAISRPGRSRRPLGSGAYKVGRFEPGRFIEFERVADYWGKDLPVNRRPEQFRPHPLRVFPRSHRRVRGLQERHAQLPRGIHLAHLGDRTTTSRPCAKAASSARRSRTMRHRPSRAGTSTCAASSSRIRASARRSGSSSTSSGRTRTSCSGSYKRTTSFFENSDMKATGLPSPEETGLARTVPRTRCRIRSSASRYVPPVSDGSGQDRQLLRRADELLREAGCKREGSGPEAAERQALRDRVPRLPGRAAAAHAALPGRI